LILSIISVKIAPNIWGKTILIISAIVIILVILILIYIFLLGRGWSNN
jgi:hypothetical protein